MARLALACVLALAFAACRAANGGWSEDSALVPETVAIEGNRTFTDEELLAVVRPQLEGEAPRTRADLDDAAFELELHHRARGFPFVAVAYELLGAPGAQRARFTVDEGPRTTIAEVEVSGNEAPGFEDEVLEAAFLPGGERWFVRDAILSTARQIEGRYVRAGWLDARVAEPEITLAADRSQARVVVRVEEGARYGIDLAPLEWLGEPVPEALARRAEERLRELAREARFWQPRLGAELRGALLEELARAGRPDATAELSRATGEGVVSVALRVEPGPPVRIAELRFEGQEETSSSFLRSRLELEEGELYDVEKVRASVAALYRTGLFRSVRAELEGGKAGERALVVRVQEIESTELFLEPGYGSYELFRLRAGYRERNVFGEGELLRAETSVAVRAQRATVGLTDPWFLRTPLTSDLSVEYDRREQPSFTSRDLGGGFFLTHAWSQRSTTSVGYQYRRSQLSDVQLDALEGTGDEAETLEDALESVDISAVRVVQRFSFQDNFFLPTRGWSGETILEYGDAAIGSELDFWRSRIRWAKYFPLGPRTVLALSLRGGLIVPHGDAQSIPLQERFFAGGDSTVRSFGESELGPTDAGGEPIGGEAFGVAGVELRQELWRPSIVGALFVDAGHVALEHEDFFDFGDGDLDLDGDGTADVLGSDPGYAIGVGLRYVLPVGPLRLDVGWNPDRDAGESEFALHFAIGVTF